MNINISKNKIIYLFTDGAVSGNGSTNSYAGYGICIMNCDKNENGNKGNGNVHKPYEYISNALMYSRNLPRGTTNQFAELYAIKRGLKILIKKKLIDSVDGITINLYTDSMYSINCLNTWIANWKKNNWINSNKKSVINKELIKSIDDIIYELGKINVVVVFHHIRSHKSPPADKNSTEYMIWYGNDMADQCAVLGKKNEI